MESRSIDFAKTASIDLMTLNNKVVNMRQVVKRVKVHVISKLCRHIHKLKMKQGTEEHKAKNLRKAQRLIEEIDSMKKLKEDNISKYALANTASFDDLSKTSLLPGPRALARLAEHPLLKRVVSDFRSQHSDWQDLAAYLLVKQTGRRFKTKKQKQKKLERCVENMNASETMTKAYIQGRFGQEGLLKAEQTFERKRKRPKSLVGGKSADSQHNNDDSQLRKKHKTEKTNSETEDLVENKEHKPEKTNSLTDDLVENKEHQHQKKKHKTEKPKSETNEADDLVENKEHQQEISGNSVKIIMVEKNRRENQRTGMLNPSQFTEGPQQKPLNESDNGDYNDKDSDISRDTADGQIPTDVAEVSSSENILQSSQICDPQASSECVVRELRLQNAQDSFLSSGDDDENSEKYSTVHIPEFLTRANKTVISDPFFAGSDEEEDFENKITGAGASEDDDDSADVDTGSSRVKAKSMFYNPGPHGKRGASSERFHRGAHGRQSWDRRDTSGRQSWDRRDTSGRQGWDRRDTSGRLDTGHRSRAFTRGHQERTFKGDYHSRGNSFRGAAKITSKHRLDKHESRGGPKGSGTQTRVNRPLGDSAADFHTSHTVPKASPASQAPPEKLHPSWEASKKRRAEQSGIATFRGSRLTFDDDD